jgi:hypothetical protein
MNIATNIHVPASNTFHRRLNLWPSVNDRLELGSPFAVIVASTVVELPLRRADTFTLEIVQQL